MKIGGRQKFLARIMQTVLQSFLARAILILSTVLLMPLAGQISAIKLDLNNSFFWESRSLGLGTMNSSARHQYYKVDMTGYLVDPRIMDLKISSYIRALNNRQMMLQNNLETNFRQLSYYDIRASLFNKSPYKAHIRGARSLIDQQTGFEAPKGARYREILSARWQIPSSAFLPRINISGNQVKRVTGRRTTGGSNYLNIRFSNSDPNGSSQYSASYSHTANMNQSSGSLSVPQHSASFRTSSKVFERTAVETNGGFLTQAEQSHLYGYLNFRHTTARNTRILLTLQHDEKIGSGMHIFSDGIKARSDFNFRKSIRGSMNSSYFANRHSVDEKSYLQQSGDLSTNINYRTRLRRFTVISSTGAALSYTDGEGYTDIVQRLHAGVNIVVPGLRRHRITFRDNIGHTLQFGVEQRVQNQFGVLLISKLIPRITVQGDYSLNSKWSEEFGFRQPSALYVRNTVQTRISRTNQIQLIHTSRWANTGTWDDHLDSYEILFAESGWIRNFSTSVNGRITRSSNLGLEDQSWGISAKLRLFAYRIQIHWQQNITMNKKAERVTLQINRPVELDLN